MIYSPYIELPVLVIHTHEASFLNPKRTGQPLRNDDNQVFAIHSRQAFGAGDQVFTSCLERNPQNQFSINLFNRTTEIDGIAQNNLISASASVVDIELVSRLRRE